MKKVLLVLGFGLFGSEVSASLSDKLTEHDVQVQMVEPLKADQFDINKAIMAIDGYDTSFFLEKIVGLYALPESSKKLLLDRVTEKIATLNPYKTGILYQIDNFGKWTNGGLTLFFMFAGYLILSNEFANLQGRWTRNAKNIGAVGLMILAAEDLYRQYTETRGIDGLLKKSHQIQNLLKCTLTRIN